MLCEFYKYQGTGNDFIIIDQRSKSFNTDKSTIKLLCDRKFGIGADGLMFLETHPQLDFRMVYYNADGAESSMCGNGGRCLAAFAHELGVLDKKGAFMAVDGKHEVEIVKQTKNATQVRLKMKDVSKVKVSEDHLVIDTGSPHYLTFSDNIEAINVFEEGKRIRNSDAFVKTGINVNFLEKEGDIIKVRTYERGVENETLSCGTGVTASALAAATRGYLNGKNECVIHTAGGNLKVYFDRKGDQEFENIWLEGPATFVFKGEIEI